MKGSPTAPGDADGDGDGDEEVGVFAEINITPLTDVILVLLIILMVASGAMVEAARQGRLEVDLPRAGGASEAFAGRTLVVAILKDGRVTIDGETVGAAEVADALGEQHRKDPKMNVILEADGQVPHAQVVELLSRIRGAGFGAVGVAVEGEP